MANIFVVSHILLLFHSPKGSSVKYEKLRKYCLYCTRNRTITNAHLVRMRENMDQINCEYGHFHAMQYSLKQICSLQIAIVK